MKLQIEVQIPEGFDAERALRSVTDALNISDNVTLHDFQLAEHIFSKIKEALDAAKPKMKKFNVIYYGVVEAEDDIAAARITAYARPSDKSFVGTAASYKYGSHDIKARE